MHYYSFIFIIIIITTSTTTTQAKLELYKCFCRTFCLSAFQSSGVK